MPIDGGLRKIFKASMPAGDWTAIETGMISQGVPDHNCCWGGVEFWVEYKLAKANTVKMRPEQVGWILRRIRHGGRVYIAVRQQAPAGTRRNVRDALWLLHGAAAKHLATKGQGLASLPSTLVLGWWPHGPAAWPWPQVAALLRGTQ